MIAVVGMLSLFAIPVCIIGIVIQWIRKRRVKRWAYALVVATVLFVGLLFVPTPEEIPPEQVEFEETEPPRFIAEYGDQKLELLDATVVTEDDGRVVVKVSAVFSNWSNEPLYALSAFGVKAYQGGLELSEVSDYNGEESSLIREVKDGRSIKVVYAFVLENTDNIDVSVYSPTADAWELLTKEYTIGG